MTHRCRHCGTALEHLFLDLGEMPPSNAYLPPEAVTRPEPRYPLRLHVCASCLLVQTEDFLRAETLFDEDYAYFSSTSAGWLNHAARYAQMAITRFGLGAHSFVVEIAANDGYLLRNFAARAIPCLGIEPTASTAAAAEAQGVPIRRAFFGEALAAELAKTRKADLIIANNVLAHVPDINDFVRGIARLLAPEGRATLEFPHLMRLVEWGQFDTVYHEHFSYLSLLSVTRILAAAGLRIYDLEELQTHGGSLRLYVCHDTSMRRPRPAPAALRAEELRRGMDALGYYAAFQARADAIAQAFRSFLVTARADGRSVAGYGAAAKGNTLLNHAHVGPDLLPFICDAAPSKQGRFTPGSKIPIRPPAALELAPPDYLILLPWNIADEIRAQLAPLAARGTRFVTAVPALHIH